MLYSPEDRSQSAKWDSGSPQLVHPPILHGQPLRLSSAGAKRKPLCLRRLQPRYPVGGADGASAGSTVSPHTRRPAEDLTLVARAHEIRAPSQSVVELPHDSAFADIGGGNTSAVESQAGLESESAHDADIQRPQSKSELQRKRSPDALRAGTMSKLSIGAGGRPQWKVGEPQPQPAGALPPLPTLPRPRNASSSSTAMSFDTTHDAPSVAASV